MRNNDPTCFFMVFFVFTITDAGYWGRARVVLDVISPCSSADSALQMPGFGVARGDVSDIFLACWRAHSAFEMTDLGSREEVFWTSAGRPWGKGHGSWRRRKRGSDPG